jgi:peptide/nickel transport system ATP-binding protein
MRQRVMIASALILRPSLLMMDEPTTALDVVVQKEILAQIRELKDELGFSVLFITHDLPLMLELTDRLAILYGGRLAEVAATPDLVSRPQHPYTQGLLASSPALFGPRRKLSGIAGSPPDLRSPPTGCAFHPRCEQVLDHCHSDIPELLAIGSSARDVSHHTACHLTASHLQHEPHAGAVL